MIRTPQTGDRPSAAEDRLIVGQLQDQQTRDFRRPPDQRPFEPTLVGEITEVLIGAGIPRYAWKLLWCNKATVDPTWIDSLLLGNNENYPYLFEVNRAAADPPSYEVGNRVLIHVLMYAGGACFIVDSLPVGEKLAKQVATQLGVRVGVTKRYSFTANDTGTKTMDGRVWNLRNIWYCMSWLEAASAAVADGYPGEATYELTPVTPAFIARNSVPNLGNEVFASGTVVNGASSWDYELSVDVTAVDTAPLKFKVTANANCQVVSVWITCLASDRLIHTDAEVF